MDKVAKTILIVCIVFSVLFVIGCAFLSLDNMVRSSTWDVSYSDDQANTVSYGGSSGGSSGKSYGASGGGSSVSLTSMLINSGSSLYASSNLIPDDFIFSKIILIDLDKPFIIR